MVPCRAVCTVQRDCVHAQCVRVVNLIVGVDCLAASHVEQCNPASLECWAAMLGSINTLCCWSHRCIGTLCSCDC